MFIYIGDREFADEPKEINSKSYPADVFGIYSDQEDDSRAQRTALFPNYSPTSTEQLGDRPYADDYRRHLSSNGSGMAGGTAGFSTRAVASTGPETIMTSSQSSLHNPNVQPQEAVPPSPGHYRTSTTTATSGGQARREQDAGLLLTDESVLPPDYDDVRGGPSFPPPERTSGDRLSLSTAVYPGGGSSTSGTLVTGSESSRGTLSRLRSPPPEKDPRRFAEPTATMRTTGVTEASKTSIYTPTLPGSDINRDPVNSINSFNAQ